MKKTKSTPRQLPEGLMEKIKLAKKTNNQYLIKEIKREMSCYLMGMQKFIRDANMASLQ